MPASPNLFKVLTAEDPKSLEDEIGCMTGIFQIFDRSQAFTGRRYGSKRVTSAADQSLSVSACESPRNDRSNAYWMFEDNAAAAQKLDNNFEQSKGAVDHQSRDHHRVYSDSSDVFTKNFEAPGVGVVLDRHSTDCKDRQCTAKELRDSQGEESDVAPSACNSSQEESNNSNKLSVQDLADQLSVPHSREYPKHLLVSSREMISVPLGGGGGSRLNSKDLQKLTSLDIRDVVRASFHRERPRDSSGREKPRASVDLGHCSSSSVQSKNLPRSSSVNGRVDGFRMSVDGREQTRSSSVELPWSSTSSSSSCAVVDARSGGSRMQPVGDWKNGLRSSATTQMSALREKENIQESKSCVDGRELPRISVERNFTKRLSPIDGKDAARRLMVELKEDPRLSVSKDEWRGVFFDARDHYSPRLLPGLNTVRYPESKDPSTTTTTAFDFRESLRAADFKDLLRASQKVRATDGPRFSVDGTRDPPHAHLSPRLSVDGRDSPRACGMPPRLKLDGRDATRTHGKLSRSDRGGGGGGDSQPNKENAPERDQGQGEAHRRIPNVVARLMGLEELPSTADPSQAQQAKAPDYHTLINPPSSSSSSSEAGLLQGLLQYTPATVSLSPPPPPPPMQSDDYNYKQQQQRLREGFQQLKQCPAVQQTCDPVQLSFKSSTRSNQKEMHLQRSHHHLHYYGEGEEGEKEIPLQYPPLEEGFWTHAQEKSGDHPEIKSPTHHHMQDPHNERHLSQTPATQLSDAVLTALKHTDEEKTQPLSEEEPLYSLVDQEMRQLRIKNSVQGRKLLRHILHAMQLKGLLHHPPGCRKQSSEDVKTSAVATAAQQQLQVPKPTVEESKSRMQTLKQQFLPSPRLTAAMRKKENSLAQAECKDNNKRAVAMQQQEDHHLPMMMETNTSSSRSSNEEQINSSGCVQQDDGPIMLGNIPDTLIIVPKPMIEMEDVITPAVTLSSQPLPPAQTGDLDCVSSQSCSSGRSGVTSSVQTSTETEYPQSSTCSNGTVATTTTRSKRENGEAAANGRSSWVQAQSSSRRSLHEPNGSSSSDTEAVTILTPRMSRKERIAARSAKSSQLDAAAASSSQVVGRDVSPRSPRLLTSSTLAQVGKHRLTFPNKEANPLKPGLSPGRCATTASGGGGGPQLVESNVSKTWSTKSFVVKDREETKATLLTLRAQSTKQDFLKGRASGGPDTPRPLRQSSSDSKLISRMTEKVTVADASAVSSRAAAQAGAQGGRIIPSESPISRSKRSTGKPNNLTLKSRTSSSSSCALDTTETVLAADPPTKAKSKDFQNGVTAAADEHKNWEQRSNDSDLTMLKSIQRANALVKSRLDLPTVLTTMPENLVTTENISSVRKSPRVVATEKLELQATSIQKPRVPITEEKTMNHSEDGGDNSYAFASNQVTSSPIERQLKSEQQDAEVDERGNISEVITPRGVSVKKIHKSGHELLGPVDQLVEQPSPVSVLDNFHFQEEDLTPSPSKTSPVDGLQDAFDKSPHRDHLEAAKAALQGLADIIECTRDLHNQDYLCSNKQSMEIRVPIDNAQAGIHFPHNNNTVEHGIVLWNKDEEREYVQDMLNVSQVMAEDDDDTTSSINSCLQQHNSGYIMDMNHFDDLEARWRWRQQQQQQEASLMNNTKENDDFFFFERHQTCLENEAVGRRVLFDGTNEILVQKLDPVKFNPLPWIGHNRPQLQEKPSGQQLIQQVWDELQDVPCVASEEICDTLYTILHKDLRNTEKQWSDMDGEVGEVSFDLERMIVKDLIDELVKDLMQATTSSPSSTGFTNSCYLSTQPFDEEAAAAATR